MVVHKENCTCVLCLAITQEECWERNIALDNMVLRANSMLRVADMLRLRRSSFKLKFLRWLKEL